MNFELDMDQLSRDPWGDEVRLESHRAILIEPLKLSRSHSKLPSSPRSFDEFRVMQMESDVTNIRNADVSLALVSTPAKVSFTTVVGGLIQTKFRKILWGFISLFSIYLFVVSIGKDGWLLGFLVVAILSLFLAVAED